jgi:N-acetylglucosaminyldiphosphoundecaprenol N-acetyl-beta-D-mannosaminyltransferase
MVLVALGAAKGQDWICRNREQITAPVIGHLGAVINFVAGNVLRAPRWMQRSGLEWLWRAKEEHALVRRYLGDGFQFLRLLLTRVLPLALHQRLQAPTQADLQKASVVCESQDGRHLVTLRGAWSATNLQPVRDVFTQLEGRGGNVVLNLAQVRSIDSAFIGLLLLLEQALAARQCTLRLSATPQAIRRTLQLSCVTHLVIA